jgi:hypothetical protein
MQMFHNGTNNHDNNSGQEHQNGNPVNAMHHLQVHIFGPVFMAEDIQIRQKLLPNHFPDF